MSNTPSPRPARLGPIVLAPGVTRGNALTLFFGSILTSIVSAYLSFAQPYILNEHLHLPQEIQGTVSGNLAFWTEVLLILMSGLVGAWSDRVGHRFVFVGKGKDKVKILFWGRSGFVLYLKRLEEADSSFRS